MSDTKWIAKITAEEIDPADIIDLVAEMAKLRDDGGELSWYSQIGVLAERFPHGSLKPVAVMERMQALIPMLRDKRAKGWSLTA
jgi:hypothetical protein